MMKISDRAFELVAEAKIDQAIRDGKFQSIKGLGEPFKFDPFQIDPNWWLKRKIESEQLQIIVDRSNS